MTIAVGWDVKHQTKQCLNDLFNIVNSYFGQMVYYLNLTELHVNQAYSVDIESKYKSKYQESIQSSTTFHMGKSYVFCIWTCP